MNMIEKILNSMIIDETEIKDMNDFEKYFARKFNDNIRISIENFQDMNKAHKLDIINSDNL